MTRKSPSDANSVPGQRPPLNPDGNTVAIPRPADELNGDNELEQPEDGKRDRKS